jgi:hypothetical protein
MAAFAVRSASVASAARARRQEKFHAGSAVKRTKAAKASFPLLIQVTWQDLKSGEPYLMVHDDVASIAEAGATIPVGVYKLVEVGAVVAPAQYIKRAQ